MKTPPGADLEITANARLKLVNKIHQDFRKRWKCDYLIMLQIRAKWHQDGPEYRKGDLVLLAEDNEAPMQWKTGRINDVFPGNDGIIRVAKVKTSSSELIRPIVKLRRLPVETELSGIRNEATA